ncbi:ligand-binding sensor domain-containing diguanylate cyclase [Alteromonas facilis]|uniref:ligand-binding sensor domain-containing diguanylate cyclase n=1 Tax=Alteromonas facilis TaxID=2048004 RepID=UPI000C2816BB|nr:ligand-binding sensor domain-containing diguanylate cyclase [Alteromonas facilis]
MPDHPESASPNVPTYFRHISVSDGLSQVTVADIIQDRKGFIWLATQNGINRYDGYNFVIYKKDKAQDGSGPVGEFAYKLALDPVTDDIWVATSGGLSRYHYATDSFSHYALIGDDGEQRYIVSTITVDEDDQVWVGTRHGVFKYNRDVDSFSPVTLDIRESSWVLDIEPDSSGELLVATTEGLFAIDLSDSATATSALLGEQVTDIERLESGEFWISTLRNGVLRKPDGTGQLAQLSQLGGLSDSLVQSGINSIKQLRNGDIWVSAMTGLSILRADSKSAPSDLYYRSDEATLLSSAHMTRTFESASGLVWQGTWTGGFSIFDPNSLLIKSVNAKPFTWVRGLVKDADDNIWFGTAEGIWKREQNGDIQGPWRFPSIETAQQSVVRSIEYDAKHQRFWVGTTAGIFFLYESEPNLINTNILPDDSIFHIVMDRNQHMWVGTFNSGLYRIDSTSLDTLGHWPLSTVTHSYVDHDDYILTGTIEGLIKVNKHSGETENLHDESRPENQRSPRVVTWISSLGINNYILGTQGSGIYSLKDVDGSMEFEALYPQSHLATLSVGGVQQGESGNLWVSTTEGVAHVDQQNKSIGYFNKKNGAYSEGYYINHSVRTQQGEIFFGGPRGMSHFYPKDIALSRWEPDIVLTSLLVLNKPIQPNPKDVAHATLIDPIHIADRIALQHTDNVFSIEFSALDFSAPENNQYAFKLEGFDTDWNTAIARHRVATYTNLDPGRYKLRVRGTNKDGVWSDKEASINIVVTPPWYWNTWSKALWGVLILMLITGMYRWRIWSFQIRSEELRKLVEKRTKDLEESNRKLHLLSTVDELTGLKNRRDFRAHAEIELDRYKRQEIPFSMLMIDIDHFKAINDECGHACGDEVLVECSKVMQNLTRKHDLLARWGGEEFIMLAVNTDLKTAVVTAEKIRSAIEQSTFNINNRALNITITIGVSEIQPEQSLDECINIADKKLYEGKRNGRNQTSY